MRRFLLAALTVALASGCSNTPLPSELHPPAAASQHATTYATGVIVPLYVYPGKMWNATIAAKLKYPVVPIAIIANVNNGPGRNVDPIYVQAVEKAQKAGIYVLGYVFTKYGKRSMNSVDADIAKWEAFYKTDGVFLDEMATNAPSYYQALTAYAHGHSLWFVMGNPGVPASATSGPNVINIYEHGGYPSAAYLRRATRGAPKQNWSAIAGAVPFAPSRILTATHYVGYLFATDGKEPECYCALPSYFDKLVALLAK